MSGLFKVIAVTAKSERMVFCSANKKETCEFSMGKNKNSPAMAYVVECPDKSRMTIENQREYLKNAGDCKHMRTRSTRIENGYKHECLTCGFVSFKEDKPLTEEEEIDRARFEHNQSLKSSYRQ